MRLHKSAPTTLLGSDCTTNNNERILNHHFPVLHFFHRISVKNHRTKAIDDTFSSNLEHLTFPINDPRQKHNLYTKNESHGLVFSVQKGNGQAMMGEFGVPLRCDIKCEFVPKQGINGQQWIYGTEWKFEYSIEGSVREIHCFVMDVFDRNAGLLNFYTSPTFVVLFCGPALLSTIEDW